MRTSRLRVSALAAVVGFVGLSAACDTLPAGPDGSVFCDGAVSVNCPPDGTVGTGDTGRDERGFVVDNDAQSQTGGDKDAPVSADAACASSNVQAPRLPANILFVVDRSGSMNCNPPPLDTSVHCEAFPTKVDATKASKWEITRDALKQAIAAMPVQNSVGLMYFNNNDSCGAPSGPNLTLAPVTPAHITAVNTSLTSVTPKGSTPIVASMINGGYNYMNALAANGKRFVVLLTDGKETCNADKGSVDALFSFATLAAGIDIKTFVLGAPGSEPARQMLSKLAYLGGTASSANCNYQSSDPAVGDCHVDMTAIADGGPTFATQLNDALEKVSREALSCEFDVPKSNDGGTVDPDKVNVIYKPSNGPEEPVLRDSTVSCDKASGWQYNANKTKITLCGPPCDKVKSDPLATVSILLGCATREIPR